jgi:hypothetical protein
VIKHVELRAVTQKENPYRSLMDEAAAAEKKAAQSAPPAK